MTRYEQAAKRAIANKLKGVTEPVTMFTVSCWADTAAQAAGKKTDLCQSLYDYCNLLPAGWTAQWLTGNMPSSTSDSFYCATPSSFVRSDKWKATNSPDD